MPAHPISNKTNNINLLNVMQKIKIKIPVYLLLLTLYSVVACSNKPLLWPKNGLKVLAVYYELAVTDTTKFSVTGNLITLPVLPDSIIRKYDTITFSTPGQKAKSWFPGMHVQSVKKHSGQPCIEEYYTFDHGSVKLVGYTVNDTAYVTAFSNPLVVLPALPATYDTSSAVKTDWDHTVRQFTGTTKMKTIVQQLGTPSISLKGKKESGYLYALTLCSDATVGFGGQNLIVSDAIVMKSKLLFSKSRDLLFEWSLKSRPSTTENDSITGKPKIDTYLEVISYTTIN